MILIMFLQLLKDISRCTIGNEEWYYHQVCAPLSGVVLEDFDLHPGFTFMYSYTPSAQHPGHYNTNNLVSIWEYGTPITLLQNGYVFSTYFCHSQI